MTMHHEEPEEKSYPVRPGALVRAVRALVDDDTGIPTAPGELGRVFHSEERSPGDVLLVVAWQRAPHATECFLGDDCEVFMEPHAGGLS